MDYMEKMREAFDLMGDGMGIDDIIKALPVFKEVYDYAQAVPIFQTAELDRQAFKKSLLEEHPEPKERVTQCFYQFCDKVVSAPFAIMVEGVVVLLIPILYESIIEYQKSLQTAS